MKTIFIPKWLTVTFFLFCVACAIGAVTFAVYLFVEWIKAKREKVNLMCDEKLGQQDRCGSLVAPSVAALVALHIKRGKYGKKR